MAQQTLNDNVLYSEQRTKINANFTEVYGNLRAQVSSITGTASIITLVANQTPGTLHLTVGSGDTITVETTTDGSTWGTPVAYTASQSVAIAKVTPAYVGIRLIRTAGSSGASSAVFDPVAPPAHGLILTAHDAASGSGVLGGQTTDSGHTWQVSGAGSATTSINASGYIEGSSNTYCFLDTGAPVKRAVQRYSGTGATVAVLLDNTLNDMVHVNFTSAAVISCTYWKTGVGTSVALTSGATLGAIPNINDGSPHECIVDIVGEFVIAYCDGVCYYIGHDKNIPSITGNWMFAQIHAAGEKIYGVSCFKQTVASDSVRQNLVNTGQVLADSVQASLLQVGNLASADYKPVSPVYLWHPGGGKVVVGSDTVPTLDSVAQKAGYAAELGAVAYIGTRFSMQSGNDGIGRIRHQASDRVTFPFNVSRVDATVPIKMPSYTVATLPSAATYAQCWIYVSDGVLNKRMAVSDGTNWRWPDGAVVS